MRVVRLGPDPVPCKYCGGVMAKPHDNTYGMCANCYDDFRYYCIPEDQSESLALMYLARCVRLAAIRVVRDRIFGRCECISKGSAANKSDFGYQCASNATQIIDGVKVCGSHARSARAGSATFMRDYQIGQNRHEAYRYFMQPLAELAAVDADFANVMREALK